MDFFLCAPGEPRPKAKSKQKTLAERKSAWEQLALDETEKQGMVKKEKKRNRRRKMRRWTLILQRKSEAMLRQGSLVDF